MSFHLESDDGTEMRGKHALVLPRIGAEQLRLNGTLSTSLLATYAFVTLAIPGDLVIGFVGGFANLTGLISVLIAGLWLFAFISGSLPTPRGGNPARTAAIALLVAYLASYVAMHVRGPQVEVVPVSDRWILQVLLWVGLTMGASDLLRSRGEVLVVLRWLTYGAAFCGLVAAVQYWFSYDLANWFRTIPIFESVVTTGISDRGALNRVAGTMVHPIELGVVAAMVLPIAIYVAWFDTSASNLRRWVPVALIFLAVPTSISRAGILSLAVSTGVFVLLVSARRRMAILAALPVGLMAIFLLAPGLLRTLATYIGLGTADPSITGRLRDVDVVTRLFEASPLFGHGPGGYPLNEWLDNQYFAAALDLGLVGLSALIAYTFVPAALAWDSAKRSATDESRTLSAALAGALFASAIGFAAFDALSFPSVAALQALLVGMSGACWILRKPTLEPSSTSDRSDGPSQERDSVLTTSRGV